MRKYTENADGSYSCVTAQDDMVDEIAFEFYGTHQGSAEHIYSSNPDLSQQPMKLPIGLTIVLPPYSVVEQATDQVQLWD